MGSRLFLGDKKDSFCVRARGLVREVSGDRFHMEAGPDEPLHILPRLIRPLLMRLLDAIIRAILEGNEERQIVNDRERCFARVGEPDIRTIFSVRGIRLLVEERLHLVRRMYIEDEHATRFQLFVHRLERVDDVGLILEVAERVTKDRHGVDRVWQFKLPHVLLPERERDACLERFLLGDFEHRLG